MEDIRWRHSFSLDLIYKEDGFSLDLIYKDDGFAGREGAMS